MTFEPRPEGRERVNRAEIWGNYIPEQLVQRPWGRAVPCVLEEQRGGPCIWSRVSERGGEKEEGREGTGQVVQGLVGHGEDLGFYPREVGALEGCGQRRDGA